MFALHRLVGVATTSLRTAPPQLGAAVVTVPYRGVSRARRQKRRPNRNARLGLVLREDVDGLGVQGQHVEVKHGFGRNYLIPKGLALYATPANRAAFENTDLSTRTVQGSNAKTEKIIRFLQDTGLQFHIRKAFQLTPDDISRECRRQLHLEVAPARIYLPEPISTLGDHRIPVAVDDGVAASLKIHIRQ